MHKLFGTDGIRGVAGEDLTAELAMMIGRALAEILQEKYNKKPTVALGKDTRLSSDMLISAMEAGICSGGGNVANLGVCPTPAVAYLVTKHSYDAGVMISASHNPYEYNGIKIFGADGFKLSDSEEEEIERIAFSPLLKQCSHKKIGQVVDQSILINEYIDHICSAFPLNEKEIRIGIDCANGAAAISAERIFTRLKATCYMTADRPDGANINENCGSTHIDNLKRLVISESLDLGIAFDGDADRCLAVDSLGNEIDGDYIMAILMLKLKNEGRLSGNTVVGTVMSNLGLEMLCREREINFVRAKVGDRYVLEEMKKGEFCFGGEQSGHLIFSSLATTGDGQLTAAALLSYVKESGKSLTALANVMKKYPQFIVNIPITPFAKELFYKDAVIQDIIKSANEEAGPCGRILVRLSGTEPLVRIMSEEQDAEVAETICRKLSFELSARISELEKTVGE